MSFNPLMGMTIGRLRALLPPTPSVVELGSQTLKLSVKDHPEITTVPAFYGYLGFSRYDAIDFNGAGTIVRDLNHAINDLGQEYDLVTNNGTGEHIFNQAAVFESCHNLCRPSGIMVHVLPWINWLNHGFYNFQPTVFHDLAAANGYQTLEIFSADRWGHIKDAHLHPGKIPPRNTDEQLLIVAILKKCSSAPFVIPVQGKYRHSRLQQQDSEAL